MFSVVSLTLKAKAAISARASGSELELEAFGFKQRGGLLDERGLGLGEDADEVVDGEGLELDADGEAALQLRDEVAGFRDVGRLRRR